MQIIEAPEAAFASDMAHLGPVPDAASAVQPNNEPKHVISIETKPDDDDIKNILHDGVIARSEQSSNEEPGLLRSARNDSGALRKFIREKMPPYAYAASSLWHLITAGMLKFGGYSTDTKKKLTQYATGFTKLVNSLVYADLGIEAVQNKFSFDAIGRFFEPLMNMFVDLNHYHLFRSFSSAFNQLHTTNLSRVGHSRSLWENFMQNLEAAKDMFFETWPSGAFGKQKRLFGKGDKGHGLAFASHAQILIGSLALLNGNKRNILNRILGVARNAVGILADVGLLFENDFSARSTGVFYLLHAVGDIIKRLVPDETMDLIDNLIMPFYNGALYFFGLMSRRQSEGTYVHR